MFEYGERVDLFQIMPTKFTRSADSYSITVELEHVLSTLLDDVLFKYHQLSNYTTRDVLQYLIDHQEVKRWQLGHVDFTRYFHYAWENENVLSALFSVPEPFDEKYQWTWDTATYPWTLNLVRVNDEITGEIRYAKNLQAITKTVDSTGIVTRLYALGAGEGVNQLGISAVNPTGKPYIDADNIGQYGVKKYIWVDKRYENVDSLYSSAKALLDDWSKPKITYEIQAVDLATFNEYALDKYEIGKLVRIVDPDVGTFNVRVMAIKKSDIGGRPFEMSLQLANKTEDIATAQTDLQRKQQINEVYAQGATNMLVYQYDDNADASNPAVIRFYIPDDMVNVNKLLLTYETTKFRAYSRATLGGGAITRSTSSGGSSTQTSSAGGGTSTSTQSGGATTQTASGGGEHRHLVADYSSNSTSQVSKKQYYFAAGLSGGNVAVDLEGPAQDLYTHGASGYHTHSVSIPAHTHNFTVPNHTHIVSIPAHTHDVTIPNHTHAIEYGIYQLDRLPSAVSIKVDGNATGITELEGENIDLIAYLSKDASGRINRGWHTVEITPNDLGRINAQLITQFFIRSHEGVIA